mmetsp:Transcript_9023/g.15264  ORF Transcript_9023/g.15264 Transcript_9023/m.15264 type:complete len:343 (+) Transcript_9023:197-1225(+)|eukprot:CAMPEP_0114418088 /NCGR_PEP_ID=MMETSP0103-20121206/3307_1 /TAXON_ID=37642 ORGANISM="Paraphysomonas imperforata, Strain PA2" /NCGR_SAMPLE_ID=MMETSP0103 /ASSEMBLY_ACC=CAM_ASM_000201 /LENGTH=342 /DNA_ID=CAMNT_0001586417 /DNA_START=111 /DNA_END=1139 /DNA_ORIENTATION=-
MGCGSSSPDNSREIDTLEVVSLFPCAKISSLQPDSEREQLVIGRITCISSILISPYSCQECALYRADCYLCQTTHDNCVSSPFNKAHWLKVHSEVRAVTFELRDPDDAACRAVHVPGKLLSVCYSSGDAYDDITEENSVLLSERTPSISALLHRCGLSDTHLTRVRVREWCVEENTQVGVFGVVAPSNPSNDLRMTMKPLQTSVLDSDVQQKISKVDKIRFHELTGDSRTIVVLEDRRFFQGLKVRPFVGIIPRSPLPPLQQEQEKDDSDQLSAGDISVDLVTPIPCSHRTKQPATGETHVLIPAGAVPGSKIAVPGPRGSRIITITVPEDFKAGDIHIFKE